MVNRMMKSRGVLSMTLVWRSPLGHRLVLLPRKVRVIPPPWIVCSIGDSTKAGKDGQVCAKCMGLAQMEHQSTWNGLAAFMDLLTTRASTFLVRASIFIFNSISSLTS
jgi:hypothetical protein